MSTDERDRTLERFRQRTIAELQHQHESRDLPSEEYERRITLAREASSPQDLKPLLHDLATRSASSAESAVLAPRQARMPASVAGESDFVFALMSGSTRSGSWDPPDSIQAVAIMGGIELDFREADLLEGETEIQALAIMGGVKITVPTDVHVAVGGIGLLGGFSHVRHRAPDDDAPLIRIGGLAIMGGVEVVVKDDYDDEGDDENEES
jgi:hypothetical protein